MTTLHQNPESDTNWETPLRILAFAGVVLVFLSLVWASFALSNPRVYGLPATADGYLLLERTATLVPMLTGLLGSLVIGSASSLRLIRGLSPAVRILVLALGFALAFTGLALLVMAIHLRAIGVTLFISLLPDVILGLLVDTTFVMIFVQCLHAIFDRWYATIGLFLAYVVSVVFIGSTFAPLELIGFGTTPTIDLTRHAARPIGSEAAWTWRIYWGGITLALYLAAWALMARRSGGRTAPLMIGAGGVFAAAVVIGFALNGARETALSAYAVTPLDIPEAQRDTPRPTLREFNINSSLEARTLTVEGMMRLANESAQPLSQLHFETAPILRLSDVVVVGDRAARVEDGGRHLRVELATPLAPGAETTLRWSGEIRRENRFDAVVGRVLMPSAAFLEGPALFPQLRRPACFLEDAQDMCREGENYLMADAAPGRLSVETSPDLVVPGASMETLPNGRVRHVLDISPQAGSNILLSAARFRKHTVNTNDASLNVYAAPYGRASLEAVGAHLNSTYADLETLWCAPGKARVDVIETPNTFVEAKAFGTGLALGERVFGRTDPSGDLSTLSAFVLSHELAHLWYGYGVKPQRGPGFGFVLESVPQYVALRGLPSDNEDAALLRSSLAGVVARMYARQAERPPVSDIADTEWRAYYEGPLTLDRVDGETEGRVMRALGVAACDVFKDTSPDPSDVVDFIAAEIGETPATAFSYSDQAQMDLSPSP